MECPAQSITSHFKTDFCLRMATHVLLKEIENGFNFVFSPLSLHLMLSLIAVGSTGHTLEQLLFILGSKSIDDLNLSSSQIVALTSSIQDSETVEHIGTASEESTEPNLVLLGSKSIANESNRLTVGPVLAFVNGAWIDQSFCWKPSFEEMVKGFYKAQAKEVDFAIKAEQARDEVNSWAENATKGLIKELIPPGALDSDTALVLANALYFKGAWDHKFDASKTKYKDFHLLNGKIVPAPFMTSKSYEKHLYRSFDDYKVLKIPYQSGQDTRRFSMYFFLPHNKYGLPDLIQKINSNPSLLNQQFELYKEDLPQFWIPRFKFSFEFEASKTMKELGLVLPFMDVGELTEMVDSSRGERIHLSKVFHKSYIEVNEKGTEAAASTAPLFRQCCAILNPPSFVADHPFMFMIREETSGIVFFTGAVLNPVSDSCET